MVVVMHGGTWRGLVVLPVHSELAGDAAGRRQPKWFRAGRQGVAKRGRGEACYARDCNRTSMKTHIIIACKKKKIRFSK